MCLALNNNFEFLKNLFEVLKRTVVRYVLYSLQLSIASVFITQKVSFFLKKKVKKNSVKFHALRV